MTTKVRKQAPPPKQAHEEQPDPRLCRCTHVVRRYDQDGVLEYGEPNLYRCAVCGKGYS